MNSTAAHLQRRARHLLTNSGTIEGTGGATLTILNDTVGTTNSKTVQATTGGTLVLSGGAVTNTGGTIQAIGSGSSVQINSATITGGTLNASVAGTTIQLNSAAVNGAALKGKGTFVSNGSTLSGGSNAAILQVPNASSLTLKGTFPNTGDIQLNSTGNSTDLLISGNVTLSGTGKVTLSNTANSVVQGASTGTEVLTNSNTIQGAGNIGNGFMGLVNKGTILANQSNTLFIDTDSAGFNNTGTLTANAGSVLDINGTFKNFSGTTLTGGTYQVTGTLQFNNANIVTNAAKLTLTGTASKIVDQTGTTNGLANLAANASTGSLTLAGNRSLTTVGGFSNAGTVKVSKGSTLTVGGMGNYTQSGGTTTVDGTLATSAPGGISISGGTVFGSGGTFAANLASSGTLNIGDSLKKAGMESETGSYTQSSTGILNIDIGGITVGTQFDQLNITGAATLSGTLNLDLINAFTPVVGETFDIINYGSHTGTFTVNGANISPTEHFSVSETPPAKRVA